MNIVPLAALALLLSVPAGAAVPPQIENYLKSIGVDPLGEDVQLAVADGVIQTLEKGDPAEYSLERLVNEKRPNGVKAFIGARAFIAQLKEDFAGTSIPTSNYDPLYLTIEERALVGRKFAERFKKK